MMELYFILLFVVNQVRVIYLKLYPKPLSRFLIIIYINPFFISNVYSNEFDQRIPQSSMEYSVQSLIQIHSLLPNFFSDSWNNGLDPFNVLFKQWKIRNELDLILKPKFNIDRQDLIELEIQSSNIKDSSLNIDEPTNSVKFIEFQKSIDNLIFIWKSKKSSDPLGRNIDDIQWIEEQINIRAKALTQNSPQGLSDGLIKTLNSELQKLIFPKSLSERIPFFNQFLSKSLRSSSFHPELHHLGEEGYDSQYVLKLIQDGIAFESELKELLLLNLLLQSTHQINFPQNSWTIEEFQSAYKESKNNSNLRFQQIKNSLLMKIKVQSFKVLSNLFNTSTIEFSKKAKLILKEIPPNISIFRGAAGNDCSTKESFQYSNSPNERIFLVMAENKEVKGYVAATEVILSNFQNALYVHTINGPRISSLETRFILSALFQSKSSLGVESIVIPGINKLNSIVNFNEIRSAMLDMGLLRETNSIYYKDQNIRTILDKYSKLTYDQVSTNPWAHKLNPQNIEPIEVKLRTAENYTVSTNKIPKNIILTLTIIESLANHSQRVLELLELLEISNREKDDLFKEVDYLIKLLRNEHQTLSIKNFYSQCIKQIEKLGINVDSKFLENFQFIFYQGYLNAPDIFDASHLNKTISVILTNIKNSRLKERSLKLIKENSEILDSHPLYQKFISQLIEGTDEEIRLARQLLEENISKSVFQ